MFICPPFVSQPKLSIHVHVIPRPIIRCAQNLIPNSNHSANRNANPYTLPSYEGGLVSPLGQNFCRSFKGVKLFMPKTIHVVVLEGFFVLPIDRSCKNHHRYKNHRVKQ